MTSITGKIKKSKKELLADLLILEEAIKGSGVETLDFKKAMKELVKSNIITVENGNFVINEKLYSLVSNKAELWWWSK